MKKIFKSSCLGLLSLLMYVSTYAQPFTLEKKLKPKEIQLFAVNKADKTKGKMGIMQVAQVKDTAFYFCKGMGIYNPMVVKLVAQNKITPLKVSLHKWNWKDASKQGTTKAGAYSESFVTEGSFGIKVVLEKNKPSAYNIYVYMASEAPPKIPSIIKKSKTK